MEDQTTLKYREITKAMKSLVGESRFTKQYYLNHAGDIDNNLYFSYLVKNQIIKQVNDNLFVFAQ